MSLSLSNLRAWQCRLTNYTSSSTSLAQAWDRNRFTLLDLSGFMQRAMLAPVFLVVVHALTKNSHILYPNTHRWLPFIWYWDLIQSHLGWNLHHWQNWCCLCTVCIAQAQSHVLEAHYVARGYWCRVGFAVGLEVAVMEHRWLWLRWCLKRLASLECAQGLIPPVFDIVSLQSNCMEIMALVKIWLLIKMYMMVRMRMDDILGWGIGGRWQAA